MSTQFRTGADAIRKAAGDPAGVSRPDKEVTDILDDLGIRWRPGRDGNVSHPCLFADENHRHGDRNWSASSHVEKRKGKCFACEAVWSFGGGDWTGRAVPVDDLPEIAPVEPFEPSPSDQDEWLYRGEDGELAFKVVRRTVFNDDGSERTIKVPWREESSGRWGSSLPAHVRVPYRYPELLAAPEGCDVWIAEGEKDADAIAAQGHVATYMQHGYAGFERHFEGHPVIVVADRDRPGLLKALRAAEELGKVAEVIVVLPAVGKDVADHLWNGKTLDDLIPWEPAAKAQGAEPLKRASLEPWPGSARLVVRSDAEVEYTALEWLWDGWVPLGNLTLFAGEGGMGKTHFMLGMAARLSCGDLPGDLAGEAGKTLFMSAEDNFGSILKPRFYAGGGVPGHLLEPVLDMGDWESPLTFPENLGELRAAVRTEGVRLVVVDPGSAFFSVRDSYNDQQMRHGILGPLAGLAMQERVAIVFLVHLSKARPGAKFRDRILGSVSGRNSARSTLGLGTHPGLEDGQVVLVHDKSNYSKSQASLVLELEEVEVAVDGEKVVSTRLKKVGVTGLTSDDLVATAVRESKTEAAVAFLQDALADGPLPSKELNELAKESGVSDGTLAEARKRVGAVSRRQGKGWSVGHPHQFGEGEE